MQYRFISAVLLLSLALAALQACSTPRTRVESEAVRDYIAAAEPDEADRIRFRPTRRPAYRPINEYFTVVDSGDAHYLVEFRRRCYALYDNSRIEPDVRRESNVIRARFDTIRGCLIDTIYAIDAAQALELEQLGDAPGDENDASALELLADPPRNDPDAP